MWLSDLSIKRPVLATVMSLLLVLFGFVGLSTLSVREYPDIDPPVVSVNTVYPGASAEVVESTVTDRLEEEIVGIEGIKTMTSSSAEQSSSIIIEFNLSKSVDVAAQEVRDRVSRARGRLPDDIEEPIIAKQDTDASAVMWLGLSGKNYSQLQITDYADRYIKDQLQVVPGVGRVIIGGAREYAMRLWLDPYKMAAAHVTVLDVETALRGQNVEIPSGRIENINREFTVRTSGEMTTPEQYNRLIVKRVNHQPVYLQDIGKAEIGPKSDRSMVRFNGKPAVGLGIVKQSKANTLDVAKGVKAKVLQIQEQLPQGMTLVPAFDQSTFIQKSVDEVVESLYLAFILVVAVIYIFLRNGRATLIPTLSIPISVVATFIIMFLLGYTINIVTLLGLTLTIGLVVDDSIVVLENIYRRIEMGQPPMQAAFEGVNEIGFAILATTLVLVSVFLPIVFVEGTTGRLLREFAVVVSGSVLISMFVSLSLTPMLCSRWLKADPAHQQGHPQRGQQGGFSAVMTNFMDRFNAFFTALSDLYLRQLRWALKHQFWVIGSALVLFLLSVGMYVILPKEFLPVDDQSNIMTIISAPEGATLAYTDRAVHQAEAIYRQLPEFKSEFAVIALSAEGVGKVNQGFMFVRLVDVHDRSRKQQEIVASLLPRMMSIPEAFVFPINPASGPSRGFSKPIEMGIQGEHIDELAAVADKIKQRAEKEIVGFIQGDTDLKLNKPQLDIGVNREKASELGVSVRDISRTLQIMLGGLDLSTFKLNNKRYDVMVQAYPKERMTPNQMGSLFVKADSGGNSDDDSDNLQLVPLSNVIEYKETVVPPQLNHYNRLRSATVTGAIAPIPGLGKDKVLGQLKKIAEEEMRPGMTLAWKGESKEFFETGQAVFFAFGLALVVVFLVLAAQFESYSDPFIVMLTVPLAISGAIITLFVMGNLVALLSFIPFIKQMSFINYGVNIYSQIGMILLIGLVTKNGILIVEFANQLYEQHPEKGYLEAVVEAAGIRFRPILMTTLAMIMGAVPIAVGLGAGIDSRKPLGTVIVGGLIISTFLTLYLIPIAYAGIKGLTHRRKPVKAV